MHSDPFSRLGKGCGRLRHTADQTTKLYTRDDGSDDGLALKPRTESGRKRLKSDPKAAVTFRGVDPVFEFIFLFPGPHQIHPGEIPRKPCAAREGGENERRLHDAARVYML